MTFYDVRIGQIKERGFDWNTDPDKAWENVDFLFKVGSGLESLLKLVRLIDENQLRGFQVDWGAWLAFATKAEINEFFGEEARSHGIDPKVYRPFLPGKSDSEIRSFMEFDRGERIDELKDDEEYVLFGVESA